MIIAGTIGILASTISLPPIAPTRQTTEPTDKSMLPPVKIHSNIPAARIKTYEFCRMMFVMFEGVNIVALPFKTI